MSWKCEAGSDYTQTPPSTFDPLYVIESLGSEWWNVDGVAATRPESPRVYR